MRALRFIRLASTASREEIRRAVSFASLGIDESFVHILEEKGIKKPTDIQAMVIPEILKGESLAFTSETGSGKTLGFLLPTIQKTLSYVRLSEEPFSVYNNNVWAAIVAPSADLVNQIAEEAISVLGDGQRVTVLHSNHIAHITPRTMLAVMTPHAVNDYRSQIWSNLTTLIFDEADALFDEHEKTFKSLLKVLTPELVSAHRLNLDEYQKQLVFCGATLPKGGRSKALDRIMSLVPKIKLLRSSSSHRLVSTVKQIHRIVNNESAKIVELRKILQEFDAGGLFGSSMRPNCGILVFTNTKEASYKLVSELLGINSNISRSDLLDLLNGTPVVKGTQLSIGLLNADTSQPLRQEFLKDFDSGSRRLLIMTSLMARGIDFPSNTAVVQYDYASNGRELLHRYGRTGRMGQPGLVIDLISPSDQPFFQAVQEIQSRGLTFDPLFTTKLGLVSQKQQQYYAKYGKPISQDHFDQIAEKFMEEYDDPKGYQAEVYDDEEEDYPQGLVPGPNARSTVNRPKVQPKLRPKNLHRPSSSPSKFSRKL